MNNQINFSDKISLSFSQLVKKIDCINELALKNYDSTIKISSLATLKSAKKQDLAFCDNKKYLTELESTKAGVVLMSAEVADFYQSKNKDNQNSVKKNWLICQNPRLEFDNLINLFYPSKKSSIHSKSQIAKSAKIGKNAYIGAGVVIGENVVIGDNALIYPNVVIYDGVKIGNRVIIHSGSVVGSDGFGFVLVDQKIHKQPQIGSVLIGDDVEIGANCAIDCGAIDDTVIENEVKIDNLVHIAHNVKIGSQTAIMAKCGIAGGSQIGSRCQIYGMVAISGYISIADGVKIHGHSTITKSITEKNSTWASTSRQQPIKNWGKNAILATQLSDINKRIKKLEANI